MKVFVTGGSGFLGGRLIEVLAERGFEVHALARSARSEDRVIARGALQAHRGDLSDPDAMAAGMRGCAVVYHCAAAVDDSGDPHAAHAVNVVGTQNALNAAVEAGVPTFLHVSTEAVLVGGAPIVDVDESRPLPARPMGLYPTTKGAAEALVRRSHGIRAVIVRPRFIWGEGDTTLLPRLEEAAKSGQWAWIAGGRYRTSTCHVDNVVEGMILAADRGRHGQAYFLTDGDPVEFRTFVEKMARTQGIELGSRSLPRWFAWSLASGFDGLRSIGVHKLPPLSRTAVKLVGEEVTVSDRRAREELGYRPRVGIDEGLERMRAT